MLGNSDIVKLLLDNGADTNIRDNYGDTALMIAKYKDDVEKSKYFNFSKDFSKNYDVVIRLIRNHINLQRARQRLAFATYLLGNDDLDYDVDARIAKYVNDLEPYGWGMGFRTLMEPEKNKNLGSYGEFGWSGYAATYFLVDDKKKMSALIMTQVFNALPNLQKDFYKYIYTNF